MSVRRRSLDALTRRLSRLSARRTYVPTGSPVLVNLGAGVTIAPGWINVDATLTSLLAHLSPRLLRVVFAATTVHKWIDPQTLLARLGDGTFLNADLTVRIPLPDASADVVYTAHMVEHLYRDDAARLFRDAHRVLKPGGVFRINVPSLEAALASFGQLPTEEALAVFFPRNARQEHDEGWYSRHRYLYDYPLLSRVLMDAGFGRVERCERGQGTVPDLDILEHRSESGLYVEAFRGPPQPGDPVP